MAAALLGLADAGVELFLAPGLVKVSVERLATGSAGGMPLLRAAPQTKEAVHPVLKQVLDHSAALPGTADGRGGGETLLGSVLYLHERIGLGGRPLVM
ncbi:hypothetical protein ABZ070_34510 [Streptomyces sp. NPDC006283]|uniref:hypothetical protein n=1 Tax=Streptomyces sp. NPDC006283 TaxID=3156741 RepID=UPI0033A8D253